MISGSVFLFGCLRTPTRAGQIDPASLDVTNVKAAAKFNVTFTLEGGEIVMPFELMMVNGMLPSKEDVAKMIGDRLIKLIGPGGDKFVKVNGAMVIVKFGGWKIETNDAVDLGLDTQKFAALPGVGAGLLTFGANPTNGQTTLVTNAMITAGFANGLSPVSILGSTGESIDQLTTALNGALQTGGYTTSLIGKNEIEVFANGASSPTEFDFSVVPSGQVGDQGIGYGLATVPEPSALLLLGVAMSILVVYGEWKRRAVAYHAGQ
jgi:hypothetical protein